MSTLPLRVLVVDDSVVQRQAISELLRGEEGVEIVGRAGNGEEALRMAALLEPGLITLDLEMPRMDGFTFLRILMATRPTPVIVISSQAQRENVFKALELGALDFVARSSTPSELPAMRAELLAKVQTVRALKPVPRVVVPTKESAPLRTPASRSSPSLRVPRRLLLVAASTGGPQALLELIGRIPGNAGLGIVFVQHMPERFTKTFAERLARRTTMRVAEAEDGQYIEPNTAWVCPGGRSTELELDANTGVPRLRVFPLDPTDRYVPSADRVFRTGATVLGARVTAVVLTGMGDDGALGAPAIKKAGGEVWAESSETAVVDGMPAAVRRTGVVDQVLPLQVLIGKLALL